MNKTIKILRVDPVRRTIASMTMKCGKNAVPDIRRIIRAKAVGSVKLLDVDGKALFAAGGLDVDEAMKGWRIRGSSEDTAGVGILFQQGPHGGMLDVHVDTAWAARMIEWLEGEDPTAIQQRAEEILPMLPADVLAALRAAIDNGPLAGSEASMLWVPLEHEAVFEALLSTGLCDAKTKGQRLTRLGVAVRNLIPAEGA